MKILWIKDHRATGQPFSRAQTPRQGPILTCTPLGTGSSPLPLAQALLLWHDSQQAYICLLVTAPLCQESGTAEAQVTKMTGTAMKGAAGEVPGWKVVAPRERWAMEVQVSIGSAVWMRQLKVGGW